MSAPVSIDDQLRDPVLRRRSRGIDREQPSARRKVAICCCQKMDRLLIGKMVEKAYGDDNVELCRRSATVRWKGRPAEILLGRHSAP